MGNLQESFELLARVIPGVAHPSTTIYVPEINFYDVRYPTSNDLETKLAGLLVAGDGAGKSRDIVGASVNGTMAAEGILRRARTDWARGTAGRTGSSVARREARRSVVVGGGIAFVGAYQSPVAKRLASRLAVSTAGSRQMIRKSTGIMEATFNARASTEDCTRFPACTAPQPFLAAFSVRFSFIVFAGFFLVSFF